MCYYALIYALPLFFYLFILCFWAKSPPVGWEMAAWGAPVASVVGWYVVWERAPHEPCTQKLEALAPPLPFCFLWFDFYFYFSRFWPGGVRSHSFFIAGALCFCLLVVLVDYNNGPSTRVLSTMSFNTSYLLTYPLALYLICNLVDWHVNVDWHVKRAYIRTQTDSQISLSPFFFTYKFYITTGKELRVQRLERTEAKCMCVCLWLSRRTDPIRQSPIM